MTVGNWTHAICDVCYFKLAIAKDLSFEPHRIVTSQTPLIFKIATCCYCGSATRGIYVRDDPLRVHR